ncbi:hypothetical protein C8R46DRAFT_1233526 [Mycena filopes]|nr:hypothetical protein C8R46DRAFT_1233526 [Mycena filopes]
MYAIPPSTPTSSLPSILSPTNTFCLILTLISLLILFMALRAPNPPGSRPCCAMPYYPDPGVDRTLHSDSADSWFHVVERGFITGTFTNAERATHQVKGYRHASRIKVARFEDAEVQWAACCLATHGIVCPVELAERQVARSRIAIPAQLPAWSAAFFGAAQRKFVQDAAAHVGDPGSVPPVLPGSQYPTPTALHSSYAASSTPPAASWGQPGSSKAWPTTSSGSPSKGKGNTGAAAFEKMGQGPPVDMHWGVKGVFKTYASYEDAVAAARKLGIAESDIAGDTDPAVMEAWVKRA